MSQNVMQNETQPGLLDTRPVGRIISIVGSKAILLLKGGSTQPGESDETRVDIGSLLAIETVDSLVLALVSGVSVPMPDEKNMGEEICIAEMELMGELPKAGQNGHGDFKRGVSVYPAIGDFAFKASGDVLLKAYNFQDQSAVRIGTLLFDKNIPAFVQPDNLLGSHFAILGATGTGKSCSVALLLRAILKKNPNAHIILLDPHSEYSRSFGSSAEVVTPRDLNMPFWLLNFEEIVEVLIGQDSQDLEEAEILGELIPLAKKRFFQNKGRDIKVNLKIDEKNAAGFSVDTPVPYRMSDLIGLLDENIGKLDQRKDISPFKRLKTKIESISQDPRYSFMFGSLTVNDTMTDIIGRLFRVPVNGKPICIFELTGFPSEVVTVVVSVLCRMTFDFGVWSDGNVPITLVCEEAHRYVPSDKSLGFEPVKRSISRIAKEGRKYGVSLGVVTQRPAEIDPTILAQCNTLFSLRMANDRDQEIVKAAISDSGASLLDILPSLGNGEAIVFGEGVALPARIKLDPLPPQALPKGQTADFTNKWGRDVHDHGFLDEVVTRWREQDIHKPLAVKYSEELNEALETPQSPPDKGAGVQQSVATQPALQTSTPAVEKPMAPASQNPQAAPDVGVSPENTIPVQPTPQPKTAQQPVPAGPAQPQQPVAPAASPQQAARGPIQPAPRPAPQNVIGAGEQVPKMPPVQQTVQAPVNQGVQPQAPITPQQTRQGQTPHQAPQMPQPQQPVQPATPPVMQQSPEPAASQQAPSQPAMPVQPAADVQTPNASEQPSPGYRRTDGEVEPPALESGVNEAPEEGAPIPGYQKLG